MQPLNKRTHVEAFPVALPIVSSKKKTRTGNLDTDPLKKLHKYLLKVFTEFSDFSEPENAINQLLCDGLPFHLAVYHSNNKLLDLLVCTDIDINKCNEKGQTALEVALKLNDIWAVNCLLKNKCDYVKLNSKGIPLISQMSKKKFINHTLIDYYLTKLPQDILVPLYKKMMPTCSNIHLFKKLISYEIDVNSVNSRGETALHSALKSLSLTYINEVLKKNANIKLVNLPFHVVMKKYIKLLKIPKKNKNDNSASAIMLKIPHILVKLKSLGCDINETDDKGNNILMLFCQSGLNIRHQVEYLSSLGCNLFQKNNAGVTPLEVALKYEMIDCSRVDISEQLKEVVGINFFKNNFNEETIKLIPHLAHYIKDTEVMEYLCEKGLSVNLTDEKGTTPLYKAIANLNVDLVRFLVSQIEDEDLNKPIVLDKGTTEYFDLVKKQTKVKDLDLVTLEQTASEELELDNQIMLTSTAQELIVYKKTMLVRFRNICNSIPIIIIPNSEGNYNPPKKDDIERDINLCDAIIDILNRNEVLNQEMSPQASFDGTQDYESQDNELTEDAN